MKVYLPAIFCLLCHFVVAQSTSATFDSAWAARFQEAIDRAVESGVQGVSMAITWPGMGTFIGVGGESAPGVPITPDMRFGIGSNTKLFTAVLALRLQELGYWSLDDPLENFLPSWVDAYPNIDQRATVRQCLAHQTGFFDYSNDIDWTDSAVVYGPDTIFSPQMVLDRVGPSHFEPGTGFRYSNTGYNVVAIAMEAVTGDSYVDLLHQYILDPFGLDSTFLAVYEPANGSVAGGWYYYDHLGTIPLSAPYSMYGAAGSIFSTASEMVQWYTMLFQGEILSPGSLDELVNFEPASFYSLGLETVAYFRAPDEVIYSHLGWVPGYISGMGWDVKRKSALCILTNQTDYSDPFGAVIVPTAENLYFKVPQTSADAGISSIPHPEFHICEPTFPTFIQIYNGGSTDLTTVTIHIQIDDGSVMNIPWAGEIVPGDTIYVQLQDMSAGPGAHTFLAYLSSPNGEEDQMHWNDTMRSNFFNHFNEPTRTHLHEDFEGDIFPPPGWFNGANTKLYWGKSSLISYEGNGCAVKSNWFDQTGRTYELSLPKMDISSFSRPALFYDWAYGYFPGSDDRLVVEVSTNCGFTYQPIYSAAGEELKTADAEEIYNPKDSEWKHQVLELTEFKPEVLIKFSATTAFGNNLYIDNVRLENLTSVEEKSSQLSFEIFPNPARESVHIQVASELPSQIEIFDTFGRLHSIHQLENDITIDVSKMPAGLYFVKWIDDEKSLTKSLSIVR